MEHRPQRCPDLGHLEHCPDRQRNRASHVSAAEQRDGGGHAGRRTERAECAIRQPPAAGHHRGDRQPGQGTGLYLHTHGRKARLHRQPEQPQRYALSSDRAAGRSGGPAIAPVRCRWHGQRQSGADTGAGRLQPADRGRKRCNRRGEPATDRPGQRHADHLWRGGLGRVVACEPHTGLQFRGDGGHPRLFAEPPGKRRHGMAPDRSLWPGASGAHQPSRPIAGRSALCRHLYLSGRGRCRQWRAVAVRIRFLRDHRSDARGADVERADHRQPDPAGTNTPVRVRSGRDPDAGDGQPDRPEQPALDPDRAGWRDRDGPSLWPDRFRYLQRQSGAAAGRGQLYPDGSGHGQPDRQFRLPHAGPGQRRDRDVLQRPDLWPTAGQRAGNQSLSDRRDAPPEVRHGHGRPSVLAHLVAGDRRGRQPGGWRAAADRCQRLCSVRGRHLLPSDRGQRIGRRKYQCRAVRAGFARRANGAGPDAGRIWRRVCHRPCPGEPRRHRARRTARRCGPIGAVAVERAVGQQRQHDCLFHNRNRTRRRCQPGV